MSTRRRRIDGHSLELLELPPPDRAAPTLVFLHDALGSIEAWRDFPQRLAERSGCGALVYSRYGNGFSEPLTDRRDARYLHREALHALPELLDGLEIERPILVGHSDGASIALIHAGSEHRPLGLILEAPHVFVEDITVRGVARAVSTYRTADLRQRLERYHTDVDGTFNAWADIWLDPDFRAWNIEDCLPGIACPLLLIQGTDDQYASLAQLDAIEAHVRAPVTRLELAGCGHVPHRERRDEVLARMSAFVAGLRAAPE